MHQILTSSHVIPRDVPREVVVRQIQVEQCGGQVRDETRWDFAGKGVVGKVEGGEIGAGTGLGQPAREVVGREVEVAEAVAAREGVIQQIGIGEQVLGEVEKAQGGAEWEQSPVNGVAG